MFVFEYYTKLLSILLLQMTFKKIAAIEMFAKFILPPLSDAIKDISNNDHYKSQHKTIDNWIVIVKKIGKHIFVFRFAYQIKVYLEESEK